MGDPIYIEHPPKPRWQLEVVIPFSSIDRPESGGAIVIQGLDGATQELAPETVVAYIRSANGEQIDISAETAHHIDSFHVRGEQAGGVATEGLKGLLITLAEHLPAELPFDKQGMAELEIDTQKIVGTSGVATQAEMLNAGIITDADIVKLKDLKEAAARLNITDDATAKEAFLADANQQLAGRSVRLGIRGGAITPFFNAQPQPTTKLFLAIRRMTDAGVPKQELLTVTPGPKMPPLPTDETFTGRRPMLGIAPGETVATLLQKQGEGMSLSPEEQALVDRQRAAQEGWWDGGFIVPSISSN
jgi:hypothetical protein